MDKKLAGLLGALGSIAATAPVLAAADTGIGQAMHAASYADLLKPIPNARATLQAVDAATAEEPAALVLVQYHHHHHHRYRRRYRRHHHHHHSMVPTPAAPKVV